MLSELGYGALIRSCNVRSPLVPHRFTVRDVPKASQNIIFSTAQIMRVIILFTLFQFAQYYFNYDCYNSLKSVLAFLKD